MFWEVWRNVTSATTNWSLGGGGGSGGTKKGLPSSSSSSSSSSAHRTRYNRLNGRPTKSQSQPANLTSLQAYSSSSESLTGGGGGGRGEEGDEEEDDDDIIQVSRPLAPLPLLNEEGRESTRHSKRKTPGTAVAAVAQNVSTDLVELESQLVLTSSHSSSSNTTGNVRKNKKGSNANGMKHSFSSFFPFTSCATTTSASSPPPVPPTASTTTTSSMSEKNGRDTTPGKSDLDQLQQNESDSGAAAASPLTNGNGRNCWDQVKKEMSSGLYNDNDEEDISDLDDEVEHLTCDVCERAFPTLKLLACHQRKKRHYGCLQCDSIFPSREVLECHREQMCHYDYAIDVYDEDEETFFESDDDENGLRECDEDCEDEERERLL